MQLPDFQRGWVWDDNRIRALIASVSLGYPVGALMTMETGGDAVSFSPRPFEGVDASGKLPEFLVLDGQQRMTSLYLAMKSPKAVPTCDERKQKELRRFYYLDMGKCLDVNTDRMDAVLSVPEERVITSDFGRVIDLDLRTPEQEYAAGLLPLNIIFNTSRYNSWERGYWEAFKSDNEKLELWFKFRTEVVETLQKYRIPVIRLRKETPKEAVCQVFENVNTGGVSLTVFELLTATYAADNYRLRDDWHKRKDSFKEIDRVLDGVDETSFLTAVTLLASYARNREKGTPVSCKKKDVLNLPLPEYREHADRLMEGYRSAAKFLHSQMIFDAGNLPYQTQLVPLPVICACLGERFNDHTIKQLLARWYWSGVLGELYGAANETRYALDIQNFMAWIDGGDEPVTIRDATFDPVRLLSLQTRNSAAYKGVMALMMAVGSKDFISGDKIQQSNFFDERVDIHHIFPVHYCKEQALPQSHWNSIVNKAALTARTNQILGGKAPSIYLERLVKSNRVDATALDEHLQSHLINPSLLRSDDFYAFLADRASALLDLIEKAMGKKASGRDSEETIKTFGKALV